jgi:hypothetical protein
MVSSSFGCARIGLDQLAAASAPMAIGFGGIAAAVRRQPVEEPSVG